MCVWSVFDCVWSGCASVSVCGYASVRWALVGVCGGWVCVGGESVWGRCECVCV